ncbi:MAG: zinc ribbon domain-containing protein [Chloroflexi bacterium]|nr:zinc ribbon domain-containing protein [Chloroflexota bacterium]
MPIYEYRCNQCNLKSSHFFRSISAVTTPNCPRCASPDLRRVMSTFAVHASWDANLPSDETLGDFDDNDPRSMAQWLNGMRRDMGPDFGRDMDQWIDEMDAEAAGPDGGGLEE